MNEPNCDDHLDEVLAAYFEAADAGWAPDRRVLLERYPDLRADLAAFFADHDRVETLSRTLDLASGGADAPRDLASGGADATRELVSGVASEGASGEPAPWGFGDYEELEEIARGGMGIVYRARQKSLGRTVALKVLASGARASADEVRRFRQEAEAAARMDHPHIVPIYEVGELQPDDRTPATPYFAMKLVEGGHLGMYWPQLSRDLRAGVALLGRVAQAVHYAHQRGILHRDLKPANILLEEGPDGSLTPLVADFGLAKQLATSAGDAAGANPTQPGAIVGTPNYMAPEQALGKTSLLTTATDVHALGAILYELLTGEPPFQADTLLDTLVKLRDERPVPPHLRNPRVDGDLEVICLKCLEKNPAERYGTAAALADDLERWQRGEPILARRAGRLERLAKWVKRRPAAAGLLGLVVFTVLLLFVGVGVLLQLRETSTARDAAEEARKSADAEKARADEARQVAEQERGNAQEARKLAEQQRERAEFLVYVRQIALAQHEWENNNILAAEELLDTCRWDLRGWEHRYLHSLIHRARTIRGHTARVSCVAYSPDGKRIVSGSGDGTLKVWDADRAETISLKGHTGQVLCVAYSPDGKRIVSSSGDQTLRVWDADRGSEVLSLKGHTSWVSCVAYSPDGKRIVSGSGDQTLRVWDMDKVTETLKGHTARVTCVAYSPDGKRIVSGSDDQTLKVWDADRGTERLSFKGHTTSVSCVAFSPDGKRIVSGSDDQTLKVWDVDRRTETLLLRGDTGGASCVAYSPDGKRIVCDGGDRTLRVWDADRGSEIFSLKGHTARVSCVAYSSDGKRIVSGSWDQTLKVWDAGRGTEILSLKGHTASVSCVAFCPDGKRIVSGSEYQRLRVWDADRGTVTLSLNGHTKAVSCAAYSPDGKRIVSGSEDRTVRVWDADRGTETLSLKGHTDAVSCVAFSPDGRHIVSGGEDRTLRVWDAGRGTEILALKGHTARVRCVAYSPDGKRIISGGDDGTLRVWDADRGTETLSLKGHTVSCVAFSPDGQRIVGSGDRTLRVWDASPLDMNRP
jgi:WD40 repeat protein